MARKSKAQRAADVRAALPRWRAAGRDREARFMEDMLARVERGDGLSPRQRAWLDELCATEPPPPPPTDAPLVARCEAALAGMGDTADGRIVSDFTGRLRRGWKLSEKQAAWLERLLEKAEHEAAHGPWQPDPVTAAEGLFAARVVASRGGTWKDTHYGTVRAAQRILAGSQGALHSEQLDARRGALHLDPPDEWCYRRVLEAVAPAVRELREPRFPAGELAWLNGEPVLVTGGPEPHAGAACYPTLHRGMPLLVPCDRLRKRPPGGA